MNKNKTVAATAEQKSLEANLRLGCLLGTTGSLRLGGFWVIESEEPGPDMDEHHYEKPHGSSKRPREQLPEVLVVFWYQIQFLCILTKTPPSLKLVVLVYNF